MSLEYSQTSFIPRHFQSPRKIQLMIVLQNREKWFVGWLCFFEMFDQCLYERVVVFDELDGLVAKYKMSHAFKLFQVPWQSFRVPFFGMDVN